MSTKQRQTQKMVATSDNDDVGFNLKGIRTHTFEKTLSRVDYKMNTFYCNLSPANMIQDHDLDQLAS